MNKKTEKELLKKIELLEKRLAKAEQDIFRVSRNLSYYPPAASFNHTQESSFLDGLF